MTPERLLTEERRARMAAERRLALKEAELNEANRMLSRHTISLTEDLVETREQVAEVRGENSRVRADLLRANTEVDIAKRRLWNSIEAIEDGFAVFDADSRLVIANSAYLKPFDGLACIRPGVHYAEVIEAALAEGMLDTEGKPPRAWRDEMFTRWRSAFPEPRVIRLWDGTWIRLVDTRAPGGDTVCLGLDISESMRREAALEEARTRAEAANRAKSAFLANMSHEIRTPMNGVVGMADLMAESALTEEQGLYVETIRSSGTALLSIINDVLDYSKIEAERLVLRPEPFDLERTILDVIQLMEPSIREKRLDVALDYDKFLPTRLVGDPVRMRQVLTNLIGNAVKFTAEGHVRVRVVGIPEGRGNMSQVHILVEDSGVGIPEDKLAYVFGQFNQVEDARNRAFEGTGLGLAISKHLVELMGGKVWVESEEGVGSAFGVQLSLPIAEKPEVLALPDWLSHALLIMADDLHRTILEKRLASLGVEVRCSPNISATPVELLARADVVFSDRDLPTPDVVFGVAPPPHILVIDPGRDHEERGGAAAVLTKPITRSELVSALRGLSQPPRPATMPEPPAPPPPPAVPLRRMRVLAAEDNKTNRFVFSKLVKTCDIDLTFAENGAEAVEAFENEPPDLIFMDISMPGMDGRQATRRIREIETEQGLAPVRIVALTAHADASDAADAIANGLNAHLTKPLKKPAILAEISAARPAEARPPLPNARRG